MTKPDVLADIDAVLGDNDRVVHARQLEDMLEAVFGGPARVCARDELPNAPLEIPDRNPCQCDRDQGDLLAVPECRVIDRRIDLDGLNGGSYNSPSGEQRQVDRDTFQARHGFRYAEPWTVDEEPDYNPPPRRGPQYPPDEAICHNPACSCNSVMAAVTSRDVSEEQIRDYRGRALPAFARGAVVREVGLYVDHDYETGDPIGLRAWGWDIPMITAEQLAIYAQRCMGEPRPDGWERWYGDAPAQDNWIAANPGTMRTE